jgi:hypothetical protein
VGEALVAIADSFVVTFSVIYFAGAAFAYRSKLIGVVIVGLLSLAEFVFVPFHPRESTERLDHSALIRCPWSNRRRGGCRRVPGARPKPPRGHGIIPA